MILFSGCSYTYGFLLDDLSDRYSEYFNDSVNIGGTGNSNDRIVKNALLELDRNKYDRVVIQLTKRERIYHPTGGNFAPNREHPTSKLYYERIYHDEMGYDNYWKNVYLLEQAVKIPMTLLTLKRVDGKSEYRKLCKSNISSIRDILGHPRSIGSTTYVKKHPNAKGHRLIAEHLRDHCGIPFKSSYKYPS